MRKEKYEIVADKYEMIAIYIAIFGGAFIGFILGMATWSFISDNFLLSRGC